MSHSQFHCTGRAYLHVHGLIFETSICLLAGSTREGGDMVGGTDPPRARAKPADAGPADDHPRGEGGPAVRSGGRGAPLPPSSGAGPGLLAPRRPPPDSPAYPLRRGGRRGDVGGGRLKFPIASRSVLTGVCVCSRAREGAGGERLDGWIPRTLGSADLIAGTLSTARPQTA